MTSQIIYKGELRSSATHLQSGTVIETDAPTDNMGKGERFSPTDLVAVALGTCMITTMAIKARTMDIALDGATIEVTKVMASSPRRIGKIIAAISFPAGLVLDEDKRKLLEAVGNSCPVERSLSLDVELDLSYSWDAGDGTRTTSVRKRTADVETDPFA